MPTQKEQIERLSEENAELKDLVAALTERLNKAESSLEKLSNNQSEMLTRLEGVEDNLCQVTSEQLELQRDQADLAVRLESQQMYSRKQTLLITGQAVDPPTRGENIRHYVIHLLKEHLGVTDLGPRDICACHRLRNPKVILVRFVSLDDAERVYKGRTKPKKRRLLIFESLTSERLATINQIKALKQAGDSPVVSYFTQGGKMYIKTSESRETTPLEVPFGASKDQIKDLCSGKRVTVSPLDIRDHIRQVHSSSDRARQRQPDGGQWQKVPPRKKTNETKKATAPQPSAEQSAASVPGGQLV